MEIIVVDSDRAALERTAALLRRRCPDARVLPMDDGMEAVQYAYSHIVDAVYTEVLMPRINGFDVARLVRKFHRESRGYVVSRTAAYLDRARWEGLSGCYLKGAVAPEADLLRAAPWSAAHFLARAHSQKRGEVCT